MSDSVCQRCGSPVLRLLTDGTPMFKCGSYESLSKHWFVTESCRIAELERQLAELRKVVDEAKHLLHFGENQRAWFALDALSAKK